MKKIVKWFLLIAWMVIIFVFSSQPADVSNEKSRMVIYFFNLLGLNFDSTFGELSNFIIRKGAHLTEYFILYMLMYNVVEEGFAVKRALLISLAGVFLYACTDEFHQNFVPGRSGQFRDVIIDTTGGLAAAMSIYIIHRIRLSKNKV